MTRKPPEMRYRQLPDGSFIRDVPPPHTLDRSEQETILRLMRHAVDAWPELDSPAAEVDRDSLLQWFALWRNGVKATLQFIEKKAV